MDGGKVIVLSPHLDDGVFSCGRMLAAHPGSYVITVFAGFPDTDTVTPYDEKCGFDTSVQAIAARRDEDRLATATVGALSIHLPFRESQYVGREFINVATLIGDMKGLDVERVLLPLGLTHPDHIRLSLWAVDLVQHFEVYLYEELPYRVFDPDEAASKVSGMCGWGQGIERWSPALGEQRIKRAACSQYASQLSQIEPGLLMAPERYWRVG